MSRPLRVVALGGLLVSAIACQREVTIRLLHDSGDARLDDSAPAVPLDCRKVGPEVCNGGDDDCNGIVDDDCAHTVVWTTQPNGIALGNPRGGVAFVAGCGHGSVLTGVLVGMGRWLNQVVAVCRQIAIQADASLAPPKLTATLGRRHDSSFAPAIASDPDNKVQDLLCADGLVVSGIDGTTASDPRRYIHGIRITCAPLVVATSGGVVTLATDPSAQRTAGPIVCVDCSATQAFNHTTSIDAGHVTTGLFGGDGLWVDRVGLSASVAGIVPRR